LSVIKELSTSRQHIPPLTVTLSKPRHSSLSGHHVNVNIHIWHKNTVTVCYCFL